MLHFVTGNAGKVHEVQSLLDAEVEQFEFDYTEIQSQDLREIAARGAREAYREVGEPVIVDDSGLFVESLDGFPGPYSAYVEDTVGVERLWRLVEPEADHSAAFRAVVAYCDGGEFEATPEPVDRGERRGPDQAAAERSSATTDDQVDADDLSVKFFEGVVPGEIVAPRGDGGFGYDPIFEHGGQTFAEMDTEQKNAVSHRGRALARFAEWYEQS
ncbi:non-canonical purine NTP pyrophosphatase [Halapricum salinum]|uniref:Non-canonical purine NTP pyrophosphatase n=1 Tax=Halapricum salinum TaxID=1457250 RepID=A0A4D6HD82_9EURY|nr:non-canonical purine NTP pyrophosphatase [Halapricum salinum]QCC50677.1 non-canonical purine NTP pyrophosphatase [Halapricum salinum]